MKRNKSKMTKIAIILVIAVFIFSLFKIGTTKASTEIVEITNVEIASKSDTVDVDSVKFEDGKIKNNVTFHKVGDELTYNVTIANKDEKNYVLKTISDNNGNESLTYSYSGYEGAKLEANKAATFKVTITYAKEVADITQREQSNSVVLTLTFEDEEGNEKEEDVVIEPEDKTPTDDITDDTTDDITDDTTDDTTDSSEEKTTPVENNSVNPKTGDNIALYITTAVASFVLLIILTRKQMVMNRKTSKRNNHGKHGKHGMKMLGLILAIALVVPTFTNISKAATSSLNTTLETSIKFMDKIVVRYEVGGEAKEQVIPYNGTIEDLEEPTRDGYNFIGWKLEDGTDAADDTVLTDDITLVAQFEELEKTSEITITIKDEQKRDFTKEVTLSAVNTNISDENVKLQYSLDDGQTWTDYNDAITITENGTLKARTVVKDSNAVIGEAEKEIDTIMSTAIFKTGREVNSKMMTLAGANGEITWVEEPSEMLQQFEQLFGITISMQVPKKDGQGYYDSTITEVVKATETQYNAVKDELTENNIVSVDESEYPIYMWMEWADTECTSGKIYYYSEAEALLLNKDASYMFAYTTDLTSIDLNGIYTNNTTNMKAMFMSEGIRNIDVSKFNTGNVTDMSFMFFGTVAPVIDVSGFNTSKVTDMSFMLSNPIVAELDLSNFDTSNVTNMVMMFYACNGLKELDLSSFDTSKVTHMGGMFAAAEQLTTIYASDKFDVSNVENSSMMFFYSPLVGGNGTTYNEEHSDKEYARIDTEETPGYFSGTPWCTVKIDEKEVTVRDIVILGKGEQKVLTVENCDEAVTYTSSDTNVITIDSNGNITAVGYGSAKITVTGTSTRSKKSINLEVKIKYLTSLGGEQFESYWKVFYEENGYVYLILEDYLPNSMVNIAGIQKNGKYCVSASTNRVDLMNAMNNKENWNSLLSGTLNGKQINYTSSEDENVIAIGSPTIELFIKSWNTNHPDEKFYYAKTAGEMSDGLNGYYVGSSENPTTYGVYDKVFSHNDLLYVPHKTLYNGCGGYWLASPSAFGTRDILKFNCSDSADSINCNDYSESFNAFRPVICLPASVLE